MLTKNMLLGVCVLLLAAGALWWSVDRRADSDVSLVPFRREVEEILKEGGKGVDRDGYEDGYEDLRQSILASFREVADFLNKDAPRPVGDSLLLKGVDASENGPSMTYTYVVEGGMAVDTQAMEPVLRAVCGEPDMRDYMQYGVFYRYVYENADGKVLMSFRVDEQTCKSLESPEFPESLDPAPNPAPVSAPASASVPVQVSAPAEHMLVQQALPEEAGGIGAMDRGTDTRTQAVLRDRDPESGAAHEAAPAGDAAVPEAVPKDAPEGAER